MSPRSCRFVALAPHVSLLSLEKPSLYDRVKDDLYELNEDGFQALSRCNGQTTLAEVALEPEFLSDLLSAGLLQIGVEPFPRPVVTPQAPHHPSLRYLELQVTWRCNLACRHCYLDRARPVDMPPAQVAQVAREFAAMGGMRLLISGGEPLAHPRWPEVNATLAALPLRKVLLTNGSLLSEEILADLQAEEVQISLDGMAAGHDTLRGPGSFAAALAAARRVIKSGRTLSIATMVHAGNLDQFEDLADLVKDLGVGEWGIDHPCQTGRLAKHPGLAVSPEDAAQAMSHAFGGAYHGGGEGQGCGLHLATVGADGLVAKCGFYFDDPLGSVEEGLWTCFSRRRSHPLSQIRACADCPAREDCGGGCRYRAGGADQPDLVMCLVHGVIPPRAS